MASNLPDTQTVDQQFFNSSAGQQLAIDQNTYDYLLAFFRTKTTSEAAAQQLTKNVIQLTYQNNLDPLRIISDFNKAANDSEYKLLLIAFFNSTRPSTSKLGYGSNITTNVWAQRNIVS